MKKRHHKTESENGETIEIASADEVGAYGGKSTGPADEQAEENSVSSEPGVAEQKNIDWQDKFLRAKADYQNLQKRAAEEQRNAIRYANADFARSLVQVLDDFERTLQAAEEAPEADSIISGVKLVHEKLLKLLGDHHVEPIEALGQPFDPHLHEALMQEPCETLPPGSVLREIERGYKLHDRVLRPARVVISKAPEPSDQQDKTETGD
ncbi:MAG: nucleotide exchange factor GrpE [Planctomycetes bacterium]|nr:nucleotide exchange factor GrpE [Planctomycetota bacterium]